MNALRDSPVFSQLRPSRPLGAPWRRLLAFFIDAFLVGVLASLVALPIFEPLCRMGNLARIIGFAVALPYYVYFNSRLANGHSIGKRCLSLEVVDADGNAISSERSLLRYIVFVIPLMLQGLLFPPQTPIWLAWASTYVLYGVLGISAYLICFSRNTRQGLHDIAAGTYVVMAGHRGPAAIRPFWKPHWAITAALFLNFSVSGALLAGLLQKSGGLSELSRVADLAAQIPGVDYVSVRSINSRSEDGKTNKLTVTAYWSGDADDEREVADQLAASVQKSDPYLASHDKLSITVTHGFNMGFTAYWTSWSGDYLTRPPQSESSVAPVTDHASRL